MIRNESEAVRACRFIIAHECEEPCTTCYNAAKKALSEDPAAREIDGTRVPELIRALEAIANMPEIDQDDAHRMRHAAKLALGRL